MRAFLLLTVVLLTTQQLPAALAQVSDMRQVEFTYIKNKREVQVSIFCKGAIPGNTRTTRNLELRFIPLSKKLRNAKRQLQQNPANKKIGKRFKNLRALNKAARSACSQGGGSGGAYFDNLTGDLTQNGRIVFGIPNGFSGNIITGQQIWSQNCVGCHEERRTLTFSELRSAISQPPMNYTSEFLSDAQLAQIMTYISRFRRPGE
jgi:hypothetical protein